MPLLWIKIFHLICTIHESLQSSVVTYYLQVKTSWHHPHMQCKQVQSIMAPPMHLIIIDYEIVSMHKYSTLLFWLCTVPL